MNFVKEMNAKIKKLDVWDIQCIKLGAMGFALLLAKLWQPILSLEWYWYALIIVLAVIRPGLKVLGK